MLFSVLGPITASRDGEPVDLGTPRQRAVLALLIVDANLTATTARLAEDLWGNDTPARATETLRVYVSNLRRFLEPDRQAGDRAGVIETRPGGYRLVVPPAALDAREFESLLEAGRDALAAGDPRRARERLAQALELWRGPAFDGLGEVQRVAAEARRLTDLRLDATEQRLAADLALGRADAVVTEAEALAREHPYREGLWRHWIVALYRTGRQADALDGYQRLRTLLADELGVEPTPGLQQLQRAVLDHDPSLGPPSAKSHVHIRLPAPPSSFLGRSAELLELEQLLGGTRLLSLIGPGGSGKTRLAIQLARRTAEHFADGCWWADLARLSHATDVADHVAAAAGLRSLPGGDIVGNLASWLAGRTTLVVIDNCEHLAAACGELTTRLLEASPDLRVVVTSREPLQVAGETIYEVPPLDLPAAGVVPDADTAMSYDAVRLFAERGAAVAPGFVVTDANVRAVIDIVRRLDGLPLAIELAARRLRTLSPQDIASRLGDRLQLLVNGSRAALPRHRTLVATLDWSVSLLADGETRLLRRLWVFAAPFDLARAEAVCADGDLPAGAVADHLSGLVDRSMVVADRGGASRYHLLETVREYAHQLALAHEDIESLRRRHRDVFLAVAEERLPDLQGVRLVDALGDLEAVHDDLRQAIRWSLDREHRDASSRFGAALWRFWLKQGHLREGTEYLERILGPAPDAASVPGVETLVGLCHLAMPRGLPLVHRAEQALRLAAEAGEPHSLAWAYLALSLTLVGAGRPQDAITAARQAAPHARASGSLEAIATTSAYEGLATKHLADLAGAQRLFEQAASTYRQLGDPWDAAWAIVNLADIAHQTGDHQRAVWLLQPEIPVFRRCGDPRGQAEALEVLACATLELGDEQTAASRLVDALRLDLDSGHAVGAIHRLVLLGALALDQHDPDRAALLLGAADAVRASTGEDRTSYHPDQTRVATTTADHLGTITYERLQAQGRAMTQQDILSFALESHRGPRTDPRTGPTRTTTPG